MLIFYFLIFLILGIIILKKLITKRKKIILEKKPDNQKVELIEEIPITENIPYYKYTNNLKIEIIDLNKGDIINPNDMLYIEKGSFSIFHNNQFVCKKQQTDLYFYALNYFSINLENLHIQADEKCKIWKVDLSSINKYVILTSLKKKVFEVLSEYLDFTDIIINKEKDFNKKKNPDHKLRLQDFMTNVLNLEIHHKILNLKNQEIFKNKFQVMKSLIFIEEGSLIIKNNEKEYKFEKGDFFGYFSLFFNCYKNVTIISNNISILRILDYEGITLRNFQVDFLRNFGPIIHYIDLCTDWRIFRINDKIKKKNLLYVNEGSIKDKDDFLQVLRLSDIIYIKEDLISHILRFDVSAYKILFNNKILSQHTKIVSLIPNNKFTNINLFSRRLKSSIENCILLDKKDFFLSFDVSDELRISEFLNRLSRINSLILINIENKYSRLAKFLHEISDIILVVGYDCEDEQENEEKIYKGHNIENNKENYKFNNVEYVRLYENIKNRNNILEKYNKWHHVLSPSKTILFSSKDYERLGRYLMDKRIGLVLSGGGARGIAHIGVIQALEEEGIPIDIIGGSSMGALIGALYCKECDNGFVFVKAKKFCSAANSLWKILLDLTFPLISLFRGDALNRQLKKIFKNDLIQNLWLEYFCITTNLFTNEEEVHTTGLAWKYIRASMGLCGYVPPVVDPKGFLVDGGYLNNVPADIMMNMNVSKIIAVDVGTIEDNDYDEHDESFNGFVGLVHKFLGVRKYITMSEIQYRLSFLSSEKKLKALEKNNQVFVLRPALDNIHTMDFKKFDEIVASGFSSAKEIIKKWKANGIFEKHFDQKKFKNLRRRYSV
ncbi:lysophospholipase (NTE1) [Vairimorpha necatrix]|uniref:Lysophospholipase NTE1 n=1 Tax=Vairimorpha necatrix TaxID=6039 RepID=A0AAX4JFR6_9MICR